MVAALRIRSLSLPRALAADDQTHRIDLAAQLSLVNELLGEIDTFGHVFIRIRAPYFARFSLLLAIRLITDTFENAA